MRRGILLAAALAAACSPAQPRRAFTVGLAGPVAARVEAEARRLGLELTDQPPPGTVVETAASAGKSAAAEATADWDRLRFLAASAAVRGAGGAFFRLARTPEGHDILEYPEEFQAVLRAARELAAMKPVLEGGRAIPAPMALPAGVEARAWAYQGRRYVLLVNPAGAPAPLEPAGLAPWRALFEVRSAPAETLAACGTRVCLPAQGVLWLEGRLLPELL
ncbi:MAG: hypothetical protein WC881_05735 [Elusimicrobiota bacterium]|jgi:hypothetical protein